MQVNRDKASGEGRLMTDRLPVDVQLVAGANQCLCRQFPLGWTNQEIDIVCWAQDWITVDNLSHMSTLDRRIGDTFRVKQAIKLLKRWPLGQIECRFLQALALE